ncbi:MAG: MBL fold metallo-hydrolase [Candidatus Atribacteria bacterium]|nr:MBL fold metallo-hydrolase [Candidatus Atribacteria bacterium]
MEYLDKLAITIVAEDSVLYESPYWGQHGVSFFLEAYKNNKKINILVDIGQNSEALLHNMALMNIQPSSIDAIVLTHCHYDHTLGMVEVLKAIGKEDLPIVAHPSIFRLNFIVNPFLRHVGVMNCDSEKKIRDAGGTLYFTVDPLQMMPGIMTTGEVKRQTDFEEVGIALQTITDDFKVVEDQMKDDLSVVLNLRNEGIVIVSGCSHAGIVNITKQCIDISKITKINAIIGGLHLVEAPMDRIKKTADALSKFDIRSIAAGHCTGFQAQAELYQVFKDKFVPLHTGMRFEF